MSLKIGQYLTKLRRTKQSVPVFMATSRRIGKQSQAYTSMTVSQIPIAY